MVENIAMLLSEQRRNPQVSYKSDILFISGKFIRILSFRDPDVNIIRKF